MLEIRLHEDPHEFLAATGAFLRRRPAEYSGIQGFAARWAALPGRAETGLLYSLHEVGTVTGAASFSHRRNALLCTDLANPISNSIYQRIGFRRGLDLIHLDLGANA